MIDRYGADALRWYFFTSKQPWDGYRFSLEAIGEGVRLFLLQLWNTYAFFVLYANAPKGDGGEPTRAGRTSTAGSGRAWPRRWRGRASASTTTTRRPPAARSRRSSTTSPTGTCAARGGASGRATPPRSRRCASACVTVSQLLAPFTPFVADEIYDNLDGSEPSVHLTDWPEPGERDGELEGAMATAREAVRLGLAARGQAKVKVRQPLREAVVVAAGREREAIERLADVVRDELNVKELRFVEAADELGALRGQAELPRRSGPRFGKAMPQVAAAVAALDPAHVAAALREGRPVGIVDRRPRPRARRRRPPAGDAAAGGLPARARGLARGGARAGARRRAAPRGAGARGRPRRAGRAQATRAWPSRTASR